MQTIKPGLLTFIAATMVFAAACISRASNTKQKVPAQKQAPAGLPVDIKIIRETSVQQTETVAGSIVSNRSVDIMSELAKKVLLLAFKDGSYVREGQLLYKLEDGDIRAKLRQLQAELNLARINESRFLELLKTETVRQEEYDIALAKLQSLQAAHDLLQVELSKTFIKAPFSGIIGLSKVFKGTLVSPGMPLVNLQEQGNLKIQFTVPEKYLPMVKTASKISFSTGLGSERLSATVVSTESGVDMESRAITVQALAANKEGKLRAGMSAKVYFNTSAEDARGVFIPTEALIPGNSGYSVFVIKNNAVKALPVTVGDRNEHEALISSGLKQGDSLMISNLLRAAEGMHVSIVSVK